MAKKMLIDATHSEETRVVVVDGNRVDEFDFETVNKRQLAGNIYLAKVTRVEPSLQAAFVDYGGNRHGFLAFSEIHPDYYQIPVADRQALLAEERAYAEEQEAEDAGRSRRASGTRSAARSASAGDDDARTASDDIAGMGVAGGDDTDAPRTSTADANGIAPNSDGGNGDGGNADGGNGDDGDHPYVAADHASDTDETIESVAEEDVSEEIRQPRKPRPRKYKIQEVIKVRQIMLVQVVKEERGNKGAALTTYLSLAGRYCVLMPNTARGGGISRKITNAADRKKLKEIATEIEVPEGGAEGMILTSGGRFGGYGFYLKDGSQRMEVVERKRSSLKQAVQPIDGRLPAAIAFHEVIPEALAAWYDHIITEANGGVQLESERLSVPVAVVDIGGRTTDFVVVADQAVRHNGSGSLRCGLLDLKRQVGESIRGREGAPRRQGPHQEGRAHRVPRGRTGPGRVE